jgi:hypothetical protein
VSRTGTSTGLIFPDSFPVPELEALSARAARISHTDDQWRHVGGGLSAVEYRSHAARRAHRRLAESFRRHGDAPRPAERARQEEAAFVFFASATAAIESLCYAIFATGNLFDSRRFPLATPGQRRQVAPAYLAQRIRKGGTADKLADLLDKLARQRRWGRLYEWRAILIHRASVPRNIAAGGGSTWAKSAHGGSDVVLGPGLTRDELGYLTQTLRVIAAEASNYLARRGY